MNKQIDFYITQAATFAQTLPFCCKLAHKIINQGLAADFLLESPDLAKTLDELLWSAIPGSFIPHQIITPANTVRVSAQPQTQPDIIVNARPADQAVTAPWQRLAQIVAQQPALLATARTQFRHYKQQGYTVNSHNIG